MDVVPSALPSMLLGMPTNDVPRSSGDVAAAEVCGPPGPAVMRMGDSEAERDHDAVRITQVEVVE